MSTVRTGVRIKVSIRIRIRDKIGILLVFFRQFYSSEEELLSE